MFSGLLQNFSVFVDGYNYVGKVTKATMPKITAKVMEQYGAGMSAPVDVDTGKVEKMEASIEIDGIQKNIFSTIGNSDTPIILRGKIRNDNGDDDSILVELRGYVKEVDTGEFAPDSKGNSNVTMSVHYYRLNIAGDDTVEIDAVNGVRKINGKNQLANYL